MTFVLDWSMARSVAGTPCVDCGQPASLRDPATDRPRHKPCAELVAMEPAGEPAPAVAPHGPERAAKRRDSVRHVPDGHPFDAVRFRGLLAVWPPSAVKLHAEPDVVPAVAAPPREVLVACRAVLPTDPVPRSVGTVRKALETAGWTVQATYAAARLQGVERHSVVLRCGRQGVRAWAGWTDGKATGGQVEGYTGTLAIGAWRVATGSTAVARPARKGAARGDPAGGAYSSPLQDVNAMV